MAHESVHKDESEEGLLVMGFLSDGLPVSSRRHEDNDLIPMTAPVYGGSTYALLHLVHCMKSACLAYQDWALPVTALD